MSHLGHRLSALIDGELDGMERDRVLVHLAGCDSCREDAVALRPMTLEEAIKEAHFRDRDVFVFRDPKGKVMILHRNREGKMELIEAP